MSDNPSSPLLGNEATTEDAEQEQPRSQRANGTKRPNRSSSHDESTPLLSNHQEERQYDGTEADRGDAPEESSSRRLQDLEIDDRKVLKRRWPSIVALTILCLTLIVILGLGFAAPAAVEEYAQEAAVFTPTNLSIKNFTTQGVEARIQGEFMLDASRVHKKSVRDLGRAGTWLAGAVESKQSKAEAYLPEYDNILLGSAEIPPVTVNVRNRHNTSVDIVASLIPGDFKDIRHLAKLWLEGQLKNLRIKGKAKVPLKSGIFNLGTQVIEQTLLFKGSSGRNGAPALPKYEITKLVFHEVQLPQSQKGMAADVVVEVQNKYPVTLNIPPMAFEIMVPNCAPDQPYILLANATTGMIKARPQEVIKANVKGIVRNLPDVLTTICPNSKTSPLDAILGNYISGTDSTIFVRGAQQPLPDTPIWLSELIKDIVVPLPVPGHSFDGLIRKFSLDKVHFTLPNPIAKPDSPESKPRLSAIVVAVANLPKEMNFPIDVSRVRAAAEVYYKGKKLGDLDLQQWQKANATRIDAHGDVQAGLKVQSTVEDAPLEVTDDDVFTDVVQRIIFSGKGALLEIKAKVDIETQTALGKFIVRDIPAKGTVPIKPLPGKGVGGFSPKVGDLKILDTTATTILFEARVNISNPTNYSATVPFVDINLLCNGSYLGHATARNVQVVPGDNDLILVKATWDPAKNNTPGAFDQGRELLSQYISGYNTSITLQTFNGSIPTLPHLGTALSVFKVDITTPRLSTPKNPNHPEGDDDRDEEAPRFLDDATFHFISSTATFTLLSPLPHTTVSVETIDATAYYNHTDPVGRIVYNIPFAVPPGATTSPRLPVDWSLDSVGYEAVRQAIGGTLKLEASAEVGVGVGSWTQSVWFRGKGIGAKVHLQLIVRDTPSAASRYIANLIVSRITAFAPTQSRPFILGLPTGSSPELIYAYLVEAYKAGNVSFRNVVTFNMDEYVGLTPSHPESYHAFMFKHFFAHVDILPQNAHILNGLAEDLDKECENYESLIRTHGPIHLFLAGIGANGHIAFNEPFGSLVSRTHVQPLSASTITANARFFGNDASKVPKRALSVGMQTVMDAQEVVVIATGTGKAKAVERAVQGPVSAGWMGSRLQQHRDCKIVVDEGASEELRVGAVKYFKHLEAMDEAVQGGNIVKPKL